MVLPALPWLIPVSLKYTVSAAPPSLDYDPAWVGKLSLASFQDALAAWNPLFPNDFSQTALHASHAGLPGVLFATLVIGAVLLRRRGLTLVFSACYFAFAFLFKGAQPPFGDSYLWLFKYFPLFNLYREPLKFGAILGMCAALLLGFGVSGLRARRWSHHLSAFVVSVAVVLLSAAAFGVPGGTLLPREASPNYLRVKALFDSDHVFGRVLWLPQRSRWATSTVLHPESDAWRVAEYEWAPFLQPGIPGGGDVRFVGMPIFPELLRWFGYRYVVVDRTTESDATPLGDSFTPDLMSAKLSANKQFRKILGLNGVTVFELRGPSAPEVWSAREIAVANGLPTSLNATAQLGLLRPAAPLLFSVDFPLTQANQLFVLDAANATRGQVSDIGARQTHRTFAANSIAFSPSYGDATMDFDAEDAGFGPWKVRVGFGNPTLAAGQTLQAEGKGPEQHPVHGILLQSTAVATRNFGGWQQAQLPGVGLENLQLPMVRRPLLSILVPVHQALSLGIIFELRDHNSGRKYLLIGPTFKNALINSQLIDIRTLLFETIAGNHQVPVPLAAADRFDNLDVVGIRAVPARALASSNAMLSAFKRLSLAVYALNPEGYPVNSVIRLQSPHLNCVRCSVSRSSAEEQFDIDYGRTPHRLASFEGAAVSLKMVTGAAFSGMITHIDQKSITGISLLGTPISMLRRDVKSLTLAPDAEVIGVWKGQRPFAGICYIRTRSESSAQIIVAVRRAGDHPGWLLTDLKPDPTGIHRFVLTAKVDLSRFLGLTQKYALTDVRLIVIRPSIAQNTRIRVTLSDLAVLSDGRQIGSSTWGRLYAGRHELRTGRSAHVGAPLHSTWGSRGVPLAVDFARGVALDYNIVRHNVTRKSDMSLEDRTASKWLFLSEKFDSGWSLLDNNGAPAGDHLKSFGSLNAWYLPNGLHGHYTIHYKPQRFFEFGTVFAAAALVLLLVALWLLAGRLQPGKIYK